jgi:hypothetical protein
VWQLFTGKIPFEEIDADDDEVNLEDVITGGRTVDLGLVDDPQARAFIKECVGVFERTVQGQRSNPTRVRQLPRRYLDLERGRTSP